MTDLKKIILFANFNVEFTQKEKFSKAEEKFSSSI